METAEAAKDLVPRQKQAACLECRKSKTKCIRAPADTVCRRCHASGLPCVIPEYHVGRYKGVKNKRSGLEKAISQVELAIKRSRNSNVELADSQTQALQKLFSESSTSQLVRSTGPELDSRVGAHVREGTDTSSSTVQSSFLRQSVLLTEQSDEAGEVTVNNADNPLQLLAMASTIPESPCVISPSISNQAAASNGDVCPVVDNQIQSFFKPLSAKLDIGVHIDPVELGLVTESEAQRLFTYFHDKLAHTRWGMDPAVHTATFVRSRSAFLFTTVLASSALFLEDTAALSRRLRNHVKNLVKVVVAERYRSVEIVLGFMINVPWLIPGETWAGDDETCYYISTALTIALDLMLNRIVLPSLALRQQDFVQALSKTDTIDANKALEMDAHAGVNPTSELGKRLLRSRERTWLALLNLDRGVCLARGRPPTVPTSPLIESCDTWHLSEFADQQDGALVSSTVLRRDYTGLVNNIRTICDSNKLTITQGSNTIKHMRDQIEKFFDNWTETWRVQIQQLDGRSPPYVDILASHTRLSAYCAVVNHPTAPADVKQFFCAAGLNSALTVLKVAVQSESRLKSMPNNTVIMVSFAACFVLGLGRTSDSRSGLVAPNSRALIAEVADVLERIGSQPEHRKGASALFGRYIKAILNQSAVTTTQTMRHLPTQRRQQTTGPASSASDPVSMPVSGASSGFSALARANTTQSTPGLANFPIYEMSDDQIIAAITNQTDKIDALNTEWNFDETQFMDWLEPWSAA